MIDNLVLTAARRAAVDAYRRAHPEPTPLDLACPQCQARPGIECEGHAHHRRYHVRRVDRRADVANLHELDAIAAGDNRVAELMGSRYRYPTGRHLSRLHGRRRETR